MEIFDMRDSIATRLVVSYRPSPVASRDHRDSLHRARACRRRLPPVAIRLDPEAAADVLRLSRGMSYKNALAGLQPLVAARRSHRRAARPKSPELLAAFGHFVDSLGGRYVTAEDVGTTTTDMDQVARGRATLRARSCSAGSRWRPGTEDRARGVPRYQGGGEIPPRPQRSCRVSRSPSRVWAGSAITCAALLAAEGRPVTSRTCARGRERAAMSSGRPGRGPGLLFADVDVLAPCALGAVLTIQSIARLRARVVAGAANNQLALDQRRPALPGRASLRARLRDQRRRHHQRLSRVLRRGHRGSRC